MSKIQLNSFQLKIVAIMAMTIDHVGAIFFPSYLWMRIIGRLTMPIMAYLIVEGYYHTKDFKRYVLRLGISCFVSILPFAFLFGFSNAGNIMWTLMLGLISIHVLEIGKNEFLNAMAIALLFFLSKYGDWSYYGVIMVIGFWNNRGEKSVFGLINIGLFAYMFITGAWWQYSMDGTLMDVVTYGLVSGGGCIFAYPFIKRYNHEQGRKLKYFFYAYYPLHLLVIGLLTLL